MDEQEKGKIGEESKQNGEPKSKWYLIVSSKKKIRIVKRMFLQRNLKLKVTNSVVSALK